MTWERLRFEELADAFAPDLGVTLSTRVETVIRFACAAFETVVFMCHRPAFTSDVALTALGFLRDGRLIMVTSTRSIFSSPKERNCKASLLVGEIVVN